MQPKARIHLSGEFSALEIETLIHELAKTRASLTPQVPLEPPTEASTHPVLLQDEARIVVRKRVGGGLRIWLRNEGLGWLAYTLTNADSEGLREFLTHQHAGLHNTQ